ncbi:MAG: VCBS repeat-containing protein, partial [Chloroflexi bacterium]
MSHPLGRAVMKPAIVVASALLATGVAFASPAGATIDYPRLLVSQHVSSGGSVPEATAIGDLTGDGRKDLAVANGSGGSVGTDDLVFVFPQLIDGTLSDAPFSVTPSTPSDGYELAVGRLNGDGHPDLAVGVPGVGIDLFFGTGSGLPSTPDATVSTAFTHFAVGDMNDDGLDDLVYTKTGAPYSVVLRPQLLLGGFGPENVVASHLQTQGLSLGDIDGDGRTDFAADGPANDAAAVFL